ncbi:MAG: glycosyltransferase family 4 protein [Actinobacteria bacterium]|nr:MAG: glycosyltransferase family 4 protein [Actinomycetota bacterium]
MTVEDERPLRVLMVMHLPALMELGGARVQLELAEILRAHGCEVRVLDRREILGDRRPGLLGISLAAFAAPAVRRVRTLACDYDVVDAHQGNLPVTKRQLGFEGLMVTRSVGLAPLYADFEREARRRWPQVRTGHLVARPIHRWRERRFLHHVTRTLELCDLAIVPNQDEREYVDAHLSMGEKTVVRPLGISQRQLEQMRGVLPADADEPPRVAFIGFWAPRKGSQDWPEIVARVREAVPRAAFSFLGTGSGGEEIVEALGVGRDAVRVVPSYQTEELAHLLDGVRAGALPSYIEGLGIGVLEKLAAGIPSICYDVPGPRETVGRVDRRLLVPAGDVEAFAARLVEILTLQEDAYRALSQRCREVAGQFSWRLIGEATLSDYRASLAKMNNRSAGAPAL